MAGPSIMVRVLGDLTGFAKSATAAGKTAEGVASKMQGAFGGVINGLNRAGVLGPLGDTLSGINDALAQMANHGKDVGLAMIGIGGAVAGVGAGLSVLGSKDRAAHQQLQASIEATGQSYDDYADKIEQAIKHQEKFGDTANQTQDALRILTQATGDPAKALTLLSTATDLAAAKHTDLTDAATKLGKVYNGNTKLLKEFGLSVTKTATIQKQLDAATRQVETTDKAYMAAKQRVADLEALDAGKKKLTTAQVIALRNAQQKLKDAAAANNAAVDKANNLQDALAKSTGKSGDAVGLLSDRLKGQASAAANTFTGHLDAIKAKLEDQVATFGQKYGPAITAAGAAMTVLGGIVTTTTAIMDAFKASQLASTVATYLQLQALVLTEAVGAPLIVIIGAIVLAVAALIAIGYVLYRNWGTIWAGIKAAAAAVWNWIKNNWPLLLGILLGPIALAVVLIIRYWSQILSGLQAVWSWIRGAWGQVYSFMVAPVINAVNVVVGLFASLPGRMAGIFSGMFDGIWQAFRAAINLVISGWNSLHFTLPKLDLGPLGKIGGETVGVPQIPHLAAGGLITSDGLIYAHAGEAISPMPGGLGPAVVVENANFSTELDIDLFMARAAWAVKSKAM